MFTYFNSSSFFDERGILEERMKKILAALFSVLLFFLVVTPVAHAQQSTTNLNPKVQPSVNSQPSAVSQPPAVSQPSAVKPIYPLNTDSDVPQNFHTYSQNVFIEILTNISCILAGYDPLNPTGKCLGINPLTHKIGYVESQGGAIGIVGNLISMTFDIPVSSTTYVKDVAANFGISKTGYAALTIEDGGGGGQTKDNASLGYGYNGLKPVLTVWKIFRNLIYLILVLVFIIIGLGIMFRVNVDARSVMTIQNQLPKIIIGIILVTLSYAIAGFIVDMMYVFMYLIYYIFTQQALSLDVGGLNPSYLQGTSPIGAIGGLGGASGIAFGAASPLGHILASLFDNTFGRMIATVVGGLIGGGAGVFGGPAGILIGGAIGMATGAIAGSKLLGVIGGLIAYIIFTIAIIWAMLRLWFLLLRCYIFFLIDVVIAPFWIGIGLIPKVGTAGFGSWLRDIIANLAVFPATLFILLLGKILVSQFTANANSHSFVPPLIGNPGDPGSFGSIIGLGVILLLPGVVTMVRDTLKAPGFKYTQVIGQSLKQGQGFAGYPVNQFKSAFWKDNKQTGKPEGLKKKAYEGLRGIRTGAGDLAARASKGLPLVGGRAQRRLDRRQAERSDAQTGGESPAPQPHRETQNEDEEQRTDAERQTPRPEGGLPHIMPNEPSEEAIAQRVNELERQQFPQGGITESQREQLRVQARNELRSQNNG